jgi:hypothetical protein
VITNSAMWPTSERHSTESSVHGTPGLLPTGAGSGLAFHQQLEGRDPHIDDLCGTAPWEKTLNSRWMQPLSWAGAGVVWMAQVTGAVQAALQVWGPTTPSASRPFSRWKVAQTLLLC